MDELVGVSLSLGLIITILDISKAKAASNITSLKISTFSQEQFRDFRE